MRGRKRRPLVDRFWLCVDRSGSGCWIWTGARNRDGYGVIGKGGDRGALLRAHRVSWELANNQCIPPGYVICHSCDTPACVNPAHLVLGTHGDNLRDSIVKGRRRYRAQRGSLNNNAKLTEARVAEIRQSYKPGEISQAELARQFGVSETQINRIVRKFRWMEVAMEGA